MQQEKVGVLPFLFRKLQGSSCFPQLTPFLLSIIPTFINCSSFRVQGKRRRRSNKRACIFLTSKFQFFTSFPTPPIKLELGIANRWETTNSKPLGRIITSAAGESEEHSEQQQSDPIYYTLLLREREGVLHFSTTVPSSFYQPQQQSISEKSVRPKPFC